jgi:hypothetical protein
MGDYSINHCELVSKAQDGGLDEAGFKEAVLERTFQIVEAARINKVTKPHEFEAVEIVAQSVARHVIEEGAKKIALHFSANLEDLKRLAASQHISSC